MSQQLRKAERHAEAPEERIRPKDPFFRGLLIVGLRHAVDLPGKLREAGDVRLLHVATPGRPDSRQRRAVRRIVQR